MQYTATSGVPDNILLYLVVHRHEYHPITKGGDIMPQAKGLAIEGANSENKVSAAIQGNKLVVTVDLDNAGVSSATGKTLTIATTGGFKALGLSDKAGNALFGNVTIGQPNR